MPRFAQRPSIMLAVFALLAFVMAMMPSPALAQTTPAPVQPGGSGCSFTNPMACIVGDPADINKKIAEAKAQVKTLGCWSCKVFNAFGGVIFTSGREVSGKADKALKPVIVAVATLFALFYLGSAFVSGDASDLLTRWKVFWRLLIAVAIGSAWLGAGSFETTWEYVYGPLLQIPLAVEDSVSLPIPSEACVPAAVPPANAPSGAVDAMTSMAKVVCGGNNVSMEGIAFGIGLSNTGDGIIGTLVNAITGIILMIVFGWIAITFPLRFIDVMLRLMVVSIVAPVLVVCAVFKPTRTYVQIGIKNVLYAGALFAFTGIMFKVGYGFIIEMINSVLQDMASQSVGAMLGRGIVLIGSGVVFAAMINMAPSLAAEFSVFGGQSGSVGDAATGAASTMISAPIKGVGMVAGGAVTYGAASKMGQGMQNAVATGAESGTARALAKGVTSGGG